MLPGELLVDEGEIELNAGRRVCSLSVRNTGDRPIQVGSHYHFAETNAALDFDRTQARGFRLNIAAGTAVRFEPGQTRTVELVELAGKRVVHGFRQMVMGPLEQPKAGALEQQPQVGALEQQPQAGALEEQPKAPEEQPEEHPGKPGKRP